MNLYKFARASAFVAAFTALVSPLAANAATSKPSSTGDDAVKMVWQNDRSGFVVSTNSGASFAFSSGSDTMTYIDEAGVKHQFNFKNE